MDAMFTLFVPLDEDRWQLYKRMLREIAGIEANEGDIETVYKQIRQEKESTPLPKGKLPRGAYRKHWSAINAEIVKHFDPKIITEKALEMGEAIYLALMGDPSLYRLRPEMVKFLDEAKRRGYRLCLVTNQEQESIDRLLKHFGVGHYFDAVVVSDETGFRKPDSRFYDYALAISGATHNDVAFLGNNPKNDMEGAAAAGIPNRFLFDPNGEHRDTPRTVSCIELTDLFELFDLFHT